MTNGPRLWRLVEEPRATDGAGATPRSKRTSKWRGTPTPPEKRCKAGPRGHEAGILGTMHPDDDACTTQPVSSCTSGLFLSTTLRRVQWPSDTHLGAYDHILIHL